jgi:hypothetical protein
VSFDAAAETKRVAEETLTAIRGGGVLSGLLLPDANRDVAMQTILSLMGPKIVNEAAKIAARSGHIPAASDHAAWMDLFQAVTQGHLSAVGTHIGETVGATPLPSVPGAETINQALDAWLTERQQSDDPPRPQTVDGHKDRVKAFTDKCGDLPLSQWRLP